MCVRAARNTGAITKAFHIFRDDDDVYSFDDWVGGRFGIGFTWIHNTSISRSQRRFKIELGTHNKPIIHILYSIISLHIQ